jgi:hypothetical protein
MNRLATLLSYHLLTSWIIVHDIGQVNVPIEMHNRIISISRVSSSKQVGVADTHSCFVKKKVDSIWILFRKELRQIRISKFVCGCLLANAVVLRPAFIHGISSESSESKSAVDEDANDVDGDSQEATALTTDVS